MAKYYALVGHCKMAPGLQLGVSVYDYDPATAAMTHIGDFDRGLKVGAQIYNPKTSNVYVVDEFWSLEGKTGGGGHVVSFHLCKDTGKLERSSIRRTFGTNPSFLALDKTGKYLLVAHHCTEQFITRLVKMAYGYDAVVEHDLCTLLLYRLEDNGDIGPIVDVFEVPGKDVEGGHKFPHLHCVVPDPNRDYFIVCDKGLDKIYSFRIDYENEKIIKCHEVEGKSGSEPRYCNFHPMKPIFYSNHESSTEVNVYELNREDGTFSLLTSCESVVRENGEHISPSDIVVHPGGKYVFTSLREKNMISVLEILDDRTLVPRQTISCGGVNPRGLCVSPDGRFLLAANMQTETVNVFSMEDGILTPAHTVHTGGFPGNIQIIGVQPDG